MSKKQLLMTSIVAISLIINFIPDIVVAATSGSASGQFTTANANPSVSAVAIYETDRVTGVTAMNPQTEYALKVTASDANTLADLGNVTVTIFWDHDGDDDAGDVPTSGNTSSCAIIRCEVGGLNGSWTISPNGGGTTWVLYSANCTQPTLTASSGDFWFNFSPGKISEESNDWDVYAKADDNGGTPGTRYDSSDYDINWYGEITVNTGSVTWGSTAPGTDFGAGTLQGDISATYKSNGAYDEKVASSATWTGVPAGTATFDSSGNCTNSNEFSLKADDTATLGSAVLVGKSPVYTAIDESGVRTVEAGDTAANNTLWLKLSTPFTDAVYSGTVYFQIANGS